MPRPPAAGAICPLCASIVKALAAGDGGDRRQRFTAKPERAHRFQIREGGDLAGRVPRQCQCEFLARNAAAVVAHHGALDAAAREAHLDPPRTGVERVLDEFLDDRGRPLNDLAGGNLADQLIGERRDRAPGGS